MKNLYDPNSSKPFAISRTKVEMFLKCPRCFYLDQRFGIKPPSGPGFSLNSAVDELLKKEFDIHRAKNQIHPLMKAYNIDAVPVAHEELDTWRSNFKGIRYLHDSTNFELFGAIDDLWQNSKGEYIVVDYKATSTSKEISLEDEYKQGYKLQAEFYQWLLKQKGYKVNKTAYFVFCNGLKDRAAFDGKLEFDVTVIPYDGNTDWVEKTIVDIKRCLDSQIVPSQSAKCELCDYVEKSKVLATKKNSQLGLFS